MMRSFVFLCFFLLAPASNSWIPHPFSLDAVLTEGMQSARRGNYDSAVLRLTNLRHRSLLGRRKIDYALATILVEKMEAGQISDSSLKRVRRLLSGLKNAWKRERPGQEEGDQYVMGVTHIEKRLVLLERLTYTSLLQAVKKAHEVWGQKKHECYWTSVATAQRNGAKGKSHWQWHEDASFRFKSLNAIPLAIEQGVLKPGMVVYVNRRPGTDPRSSDLSNKPHWFTYLGRNSSGEPQFSDQYFVSTGFAKMKSWVAGRRIDAFYDPYFRQGSFDSNDAG